MRSRFAGLLLLTIALCAAADAWAAFSSGSTGVDGLFNPSTNTVVDLSLAGTGAGHGTYDPARWAVVFNYTNAIIPAGVTVTFKNHPSGAPVVWLLSGYARIAGTVKLSGSAGSAVPNVPTFAEPGPGGFEGGRRTIETGVTPGTAGLGPGGGQYSLTLNVATLGAGGGYGTAGLGDSFGAVGGVTYGNEAVLPLIGGSGGSAGDQTNFGGGGSGGGAILIAATDSIVVVVNGAVLANGGDRSSTLRGGGGSGGAIRLVSNSVGGDGILRAKGGLGSFVTTGVGGKGRIRVEAPPGANYLTDLGDPNYVVSGVPGPLFPDASGPTLVVTRIQTALGDVLVPADPLAGILTNDAVVQDSLVTPVTLFISAMNIPPGTTVQVLLTRDAGPRETVTTGPLLGSLAFSQVAVLIGLPRGRKTEVVLSADITPAGVATSPPMSVRP